MTPYNPYISHPWEGARWPRSVRPATPNVRAQGRRGNAGSGRGPALPRDIPWASRRAGEDLRTATRDNPTRVLGHTPRAPLQEGGQPVTALTDVFVFSAEPLLGADRAE